MKHNARRKLNAALALCIAGVGSGAQANDEQIEEVVIWGTQVRASSVNLGEEDIAIRQADHISDLLRTVPGVDVGGSHSLNQRVTIRSLGDRNLRVSIDGANQNNYMYHHMGNLQIHADILQSVNIDVGTNSVVDGGLGGAVRFETKDAAQLLREGQDLGARVQAFYGDNASEGYAASGYGRVGDSVDFLAYYHYLDRDNYEVGGGEIEDENGDEVPGTNGEVKGQEGELDNVLVKLGWDLLPGQRLEFSYEGYEDEGDYSYRPDMGLATDIAIADSLGLPLTYDTEFKRDTYLLGYELDWGEGSTLRATVYNNKSTLWRDESAIAEAFPGSPSRIEGKAENTGLNLFAYSVLGRHALTYGLDVIDHDTEYKPDGTKVSDEQSTDSALFVQDRITLGEQFALVPGLRYNYYEVDSHVVDDDFDELSAALAGEWQVSNSLLFKLSGTQLFQGPEIAEVFIGAGVDDAPNPDIKAQTGLNTELSAAYEDGVLGADRFSAGVTLFRTDIDDYIYEYAPPPAGVDARYWKDNVGDMEIEGVEAYLGYDIGGLSTLLTYSIADSDLSASAAYDALDGARIDREQGDTVSFMVDYALPAWDLALHWDLLWVDDLDAGSDLDGASLDNAKDGYTVHNVSARWTPQFVQGLELTVGVDNLFDEYYSSQSSRTGVSAHPRFGELYLTDYEPGRNIKGTIAYNF
ncbi:MAG: Fe-regulated protein B [Halioglobus sp.]|nr:Fe-regulated protein B [Halioglobus sp.]